MKELQDIINDLQARLAIVGGGRIIITSDSVLKSVWAKNTKISRFKKTKLMLRCTTKCGDNKLWKEKNTLMRFALANH